MFVLYNFFISLLIIFLFPYFLYKVIRYKKYQSGLAERIGFVSSQKIEKLLDKRLWIHAVSVGEASATLPLYLAFKEKHPDISVVWSTTTRTGQEWISKRLLMGDISIYFPLDLYFSVWMILKTIKPMGVVIVETEIWPNFWWEVTRRRIPSLLINARLSDRSTQGYVRLSFLFRSLLRSVKKINVQTKEDAEKFLKIGAFQHQVSVTGNLKFDAAWNQTIHGEDVRELQKKYGLWDKLVWVAGSTHAGEEKILLECIKELSNSFPNLRLVLVPRHPERFNEVDEIIKREGWRSVRSSDGRHKGLEIGSVLLVDEMGVLPQYYALATLVFIGKSLTAQGGQNFLEPAALGKPVLVGPYMENFKVISTEFIEKRGIRQVQTKEDLLQVARALLESSSEREKVGEEARRLVKQHCGAMLNNLETIEKEILWQN